MKCREGCWASFVHVLVAWVCHMAMLLGPQAGIPYVKFYKRNKFVRLKSMCMCIFLPTQAANLLYILD
jgi:hypothetical protein